MARIESGTTRIDSVEMCWEQFRDEQFNVISFDDFPGVFGDRPIDAIFGTVLFERFVVTQDYISHKLTLTDPAEF